MQKTQKKTMMYLIGALVLAMAGILYNGAEFPLTNSYIGNSFIIMSHFVFVTLLLGWVISLQRRILNAQIRRYLITVGILMASWLTVRTCKWFFVSVFDALCRYMWYAFYIPMILIPLLGVFITIYIGKPDGYKMPKALNLLYIPAALLILFVFTNDFHNLVFKFPKGIELFDSDYTYGFGFYIVAAWFSILGFYFAVMLIVKSRVPGSKTFQKLPLIIMACSVAFWVLYAMKLIKADLTAVDCLMITMLLESAIQSGLIRSNIGYTELFEISTVAAQVVDENFQTSYISSYADDFSEDIMRSAVVKPVDLGKTMLHGKPVSGGYVLWQNDVKQIKKLMKSLEETRERLSENNYLLKAEIDIKEQKARFDEKNRLYDRIAEDVALQLSKADELLVEIEKDPGSAKNNLSRICVLSAYIKRRSNLLLLGEENKVISSTELEFCLRESLDNIKLLDVFSSLDSKSSGLIDVETAVAIYDAFEKIIEMVLLDINAIMVSLRCEDNAVKLCLQIGCEDSADISALNNIELVGGKFTFVADDNDITIDMSFEQGGVADA